MNPTTLLLGMLLGCLCLAAPAAETAPPASAAALTADANKPPADPARPAALGASRPPYSLREETETEQVLYDGNVIARKSSSPSYRDSAGNTRREYHSSFSDLTRIYITLAGGTRYTLDPVAKTATKSMAPLSAAALAAARSKPATPNGAQEIRVRVVDTPSPQLAKSAADVFADNKPRRVHTRTPLGTREINGEICTGTLMSYVIAAGEQGNLNAITVSTEIWISDALRVTIFSKTTDPRSGNTTTRAVEITRGEPDPALFVVPPDYTIVEDPPPVAP